jgi:hypothetical protein
MTGPVKMKLALLALGGALAGCGTTPSTRTPVGTTEITAAEVDSDRESAPRVGKSQRNEEADASDLFDKQPERHDKRPGGGFSGHK